MKKILELRIGSHLYGTNTLTSDEDYSGVFIPSEDYVFGLLTVNEVDESVVSKLATNKNSPDAIDKKFYELRRFLKLAMDNNPNVIEQVFVNSENIISIDKYGQLILDNALLFPYKGLTPKFLGYASGQKKRMQVKPENHSALEIGLEYLKNKHEKLRLVDVLNEDGCIKTIERMEYCVKIGDMQFPFNTLVKHATKKIQERLDTASYRTKMYDLYGYDTKYASHIIRLLEEGIELVETGKLTFPLKSKDVILDIKAGKYKLNEVIELSEYLEEKFKVVDAKSMLPSKPNFDAINGLAKHILQDYFNVKKK